MTTYLGIILFLISILLFPYIAYRVGRHDEKIKQSKISKDSTNEKILPPS